MEVNNIYTIDNSDRILVKAIDSVDNSELDNIPFGFFVEGVFKYYYNYLMKYFEDIEITHRQAYIILALDYKDTVTQEHIASVLSSNEATITREINALEKRNLILRKTDDKDKRKKMVLLTDEGTELAKRLKEQYGESVNEILNYINEEEFYILKLLLKKVYITLGELSK